MKKYEKIIKPLLYFLVLSTYLLGCSMYKGEGGLALVFLSPIIFIFFAGISLILFILQNRQWKISKMGVASPIILFVSLYIPLFLYPEIFRFYPYPENWTMEFISYDLDEYLTGVLIVLNICLMLSLLFKNTKIQWENVIFKALLFLNIMAIIIAGFTNLIANIATNRHFDKAKKAGATFEHIGIRQLEKDNIVIIKQFE